MCPEPSSCSSSFSCDLLHFARKKSIRNIKMHPNTNPEPKYTISLSDTVQLNRSSPNTAESEDKVVFEVFMSLSQRKLAEEIVQKEYNKQDIFLSKNAWVHIRFCLRVGTST